MLSTIPASAPRPITSRFRDRVDAFAEAEGIPVIRLTHGERKDDRANELRRMILVAAPFACAPLAGRRVRRLLLRP